MGDRASSRVYASTRKTNAVQFSSLPKQSFGNIGSRSDSHPISANQPNDAVILAHADEDRNNGERIHGTRCPFTPKCYHPGMNQSPSDFPSDSVEEILRRQFHLDQFRGFQRQVIDRSIAGGHSLVIMPTGGGKSLCFQIPAVFFSREAEQVISHEDAWVARPEAPQPASAPKPLTVVLSPLVALMKDQVDALRARGLNATTINSLVSREDRERRYQGIADGRYSLLYVTPERFRKEAFLAALQSGTFRYWRSMKPIVSANGDMTFVLTIPESPRSVRLSAIQPRSRLRQPRPPTSKRTSFGS